MPIAKHLLEILWNPKAFPLQNVWKSFEIMRNTPIAEHMEIQWNPKGCPLQHLWKSQKIIRNTPNCRTHGNPMKSRGVPIAIIWTIEVNSKGRPLLNVWEANEILGGTWWNLKGHPVLNVWKHKKWILRGAPCKCLRWQWNHKGVPIAIHMDHRSES